MDLFNSYRDPFLNDEEESEEEENPNPIKTDGEDEDGVLKDAPEEFEEESSWDER
jgi:hypothetical protein